MARAVVFRNGRFLGLRLYLAPLLQHRPAIFQCKAKPTVKPMVLAVDVDVGPPPYSASRPDERHILDFRRVNSD